jgi:hypothetical protein
MIASHRHRFIFLKTSKTAGTSVELALSELCGESDVITPLVPSDETLRRGRGPQHYVRVERHDPVRRHDGLIVPDTSYDFYNHIPAARVREYFPAEIWKTYYKFAFERNPWDRQVSHYYWHYHYLGVQLPPFEVYLQMPEARRRNFDIYSIGGCIAVDFVGRYEQLTTDLQTVVERLGLDGSLTLPLAKKGPRPSEDSYRRYYTPDTRDMLAEWYASEIDAFGYAF